MDKYIIALICIMLPGCSGLNLQPLDLKLKVEALDGLVSVEPEVVVGDGKIGPTSIEIEVNEEVVNEIVDQVVEEGDE